MPSRRDGGARFVTRQLLYLLEPDVREIQASLLAALPRLRFFARPRLIDSKATDASPAYQEACRKGWYEKPVIATPEASWTFQYFDNLSALEEGVAAWVEPPGWSPTWEKDRWGRPHLVNEPLLSFDYSPAKIFPQSWGKMAGDAPLGCRPSEHLQLIEGSFHGVYYPWEPEKLSFLRRVRRIFDKHTTNKCCTVEPETMRPRVVERRGSWNRIGFHAAEWAMAHPRHLLGRYFVKPFEWAERYPNGWHPD